MRAVSGWVSGERRALTGTPYGGQSCAGCAVSGRAPPAVGSASCLANSPASGSCPRRGPAVRPIALRANTVSARSRVLLRQDVAQVEVILAELAAVVAGAHAQHA